MTEHCNHECVCSCYVGSTWHEQSSPCGIPSAQCPNDTRNQPDPLALLEAWRKWKEDDWDSYTIDDWNTEKDFIKQLRTNPSAVRDQGIKEGWWKE